MIEVILMSGGRQDDSTAR